MAEPKTTAAKSRAKTPAPKNRVEVFIPKGPANGDPNLFVSVNGVNYLLPRGKKSFVPPEIADEVQRSIEAQEALDAQIDAMLEESGQM